MLELKMDKEGFLVDDKGERVLIGDEPIKVKDVKTQDEIDALISERLARQAKHIKALEETANKTPEIQKMLDDLRAEHNKTKADLETAKESAQAEVSQQISTLSKRAETAEQQRDQATSALLVERLTTSILGACGDVFADASMDVIPKLLPAHKREPVLNDQTGKPVPNQFSDLYEVEIFDGEGNSKKEFLLVDKAVEAFAANPAHGRYLADRKHGAGGGSYRQTTPTGDPSKLSPKEKIKRGLQKGQHLRSQ